MLTIFGLGIAFTAYISVRFILEYMEDARWEREYKEKGFNINDLYS
jgi:hypothetical protein